ncbi:MAG: anti-sigma factor, partial [Phormidesmis sp.]
PVRFQPVRFQPVRFQKEMLLIVTGALTILSLYLGSQNYRLQQALKAVQATQVASGQTDGAAELVTYSLDKTENTTEAEQNSSVELSVDSDRLTAVLEVEGLPTLPDDRVYALWTVAAADAPATKDAKNAILTAVFTVNEAGNQIEKIVLPGVFRDRTQVQAIAITVEDAASPQDHESSPILIRRL